MLQPFFITLHEIGENAFCDSHLDGKMLTHAAFHFWINTSVAFFFSRTDTCMTRRKTDGILELAKSTFM